MGFLNWIKGEVCRGSNPPCGGGEITRAEWEAMRTTFTESAVQRGNGNGGPGPVPPRLPDDLADLPELTAQHLDGAAAAPASAEMPSDELLDQWVQEARRVHTASGYHINASTTMALLAIAWARQQQAQSLQLPPPGAEPVATDGELVDVWHPLQAFRAVLRALYQRGRADERIAILRALGVEP